MEFQIGDQFYKRVGKNQKVLCTIHDIIQVTKVSTRQVKSFTSTEYWATSEEYGMGNAFEVAKVTIARSPIKLTKNKE